MKPRLPRVLIVTPPLLQFTAPYPASPLLAAYLRQHSVPVVQADLALELALRLFSRRGLKDFLGEIFRCRRWKRVPILRFFCCKCSPLPGHSRRGDQVSADRRLRASTAHTFRMAAHGTPFPSAERLEQNISATSENQSRRTRPSLSKPLS